LDGQPFVVSLLIDVTGLFLFLASLKKDQKAEVDTKSASFMGIAPGISGQGPLLGLHFSRE
jgi:hypothetical protein